VTARVYVCGSFRFADRVAEVGRLLSAAGVEHLTSAEPDPDGIASCLAKIDAAESVYVVNPGGYVGRSLCFDLGYAVARGRPIRLMEPVEDPPVGRFVAAVCSPDGLVGLLTEAGRVPIVRGSI